MSRSPSRKPITTCRATSNSSLRLVLVNTFRHYRPDSPFGPRPETIAYLISESVLTEPLAMRLYRPFFPTSGPLFHASRTTRIPPPTRYIRFPNFSYISMLDCAGTFT